MMSSEQKPTSKSAILRAMFAAAAVLVAASVAEARPIYYETFKDHFGVVDGSNLDACGVCHIKWTGTGARNPFGSSVEQQLYLGKSVVQALDDAALLDADGDGYTSGAEIMTYMTLPGYNCENFVLATGAPTGYDTYITPLVATCLDPLDIRVNPTTSGAVVFVGEQHTIDITVFNNGSNDPLEISAYELLPGAPVSLMVTGPAAPFSIPVGQSVVLQLVFSPTGPVLSHPTLRIHSNDPDEGVVDVDLSLFAVPDPTLPGAQRGPCYGAIQKAMSKYAKAQLRVWGDCYMEELAGRACDTGARTIKLGKAAAKLADVLGGSKDTACSGAGLTGSTLGFPTTCAPGCEDHPVGAVRDIPACLQCVQDQVMEGVLREGIGTAPPDLPPNVVDNVSAYSCEKRIVRGMQKGLLSMYSELGACELTAMLNDAAPGACESSLATELDELKTRLDAIVGKCTVTTDLLGCRFEGMSPDPACLGLAAEDLAVQLTNATFGIE